jgi:surface antigen
MKRTVVLGALLLLLTTWAGPVQGQNFGALDQPEQQAMSDTFQYALENNPANRPADWVNPDTGRSGAVLPVRTFQNTHGQPCREFISTITIGGREEQGYGTACRQPDGSWQIVSDQWVTAPPPPPAQTNVYLYQPPERYYYYPSAFFSPHRIFLSFDFVYRSGHHQRGSYFLDGRSFRQRYPVHVRSRHYFVPRIDDGYRRHGGRDDRDGFRDRDRSRDRDRDRSRGRLDDRGRGRGGRD